jgi:acylglycerol lipase
MDRLHVARLRAEFKEPHDLIHASDGKILFLRRWDPPAAPVASILVLHGITAYSRPYGPILAEELARTGYRVYGLDLRGHGLSDGRRGDIPSEARLVSDLRETLAFVRARSPKLVLLGHSLGVLLTIRAVNSSPDRIDGLVLLSAARTVRKGVYPKPSSTALIKILLGVTLFRGRPLIEYRRSGMTGVDDSLFNFHYSARFMSTLYGAGAFTVARMFREGVLDSPNLSFSRKLSVPLFVGVGEQDELFSVDAARSFFDGIDCDRKEFAVIPGARHAVFPSGCWTQLEAWLNRAIV